MWFILILILSGYYYISTNIIDYILHYVKSFKQSIIAMLVIFIYIIVTGLGLVYIFDKFIDYI